MSKPVYPNWKIYVDPKIKSAYKMYRELESFGFSIKDCAFSCGCSYGTLRQYVSQKKRGIVDI